MPTIQFLKRKKKRKKTPTVISHFSQAPQDLASSHSSYSFLSPLTLFLTCPQSWWPPCYCSYRRGIFYLRGFIFLFVLPVKYLRSVTHTGAPCLYDWPAVQNASVRPMGLLETEQLRSVTWVWHAYMTGLQWKPWTSRPRLASLDDNSSRTLSHITAGELSIVHTTPLEEDNLKLMPGFF